MAGGGSDDPNVFNPEIYSVQRIRVAPTLILIGFGVQIFAILKNFKKIWKHHTMERRTWQQVF